MDRFILQKSETPNYWVCTDQVNLIVCVFENHKYNNTQKFSFLGDYEECDVMDFARFAREMGEWLFNNHYEKVF